MTRLYLIRHGHYVGVANGFLMDKGLSPLGVRQVERLRDRLAATKEIAADALISSTMPRALQTAGILAPALGLPVMENPDVQEWHNDETEPITPEDFGARLAATPALDVPYVQLVPGAETRAEFMARAGTALHRIIRAHEGKVIVVVCHGGIVEASFHYFFGLSTLRLPPAFVDVAHTAITCWQTLEDPGLGTLWTLSACNDATHLRDLDTPARIPWAELALPWQEQPDADREPATVETRVE